MASTHARGALTRIDAGDLEELEQALLDWAEGRGPRHARLTYAWRALRATGHRPEPDSERRIDAALRRLAGLD